MHPLALPLLDSLVRPFPVHTPVPPAPAPLADPSKFPRTFRMAVEGRGLHPLVTDGTVLTFDKAAAMGPMTIVGICLSPAAAVAAFSGRQWLAKRLVEAFPAGTRLGAQAATGRAMRCPRMIVEQVNPFRQYAFTPDQVLAVYACVGVAADGPEDRRPEPAAFALEGRHHG